MDTILAYLAGIIDADGSISIGIDRARQKIGRSLAFNQAIHVSQVKSDAIDLLHETFGGNISIRKGRGAGQQDINRWYVYGKAASEVARQLLPFLRIKREQALLIIALDGIKKRGRKANTDLVGPHKRVLKQSVVDEMMAIAKEVRSLNDTRFPL